MTVFLIILGAAVLNAAMDAIDHAKGAETLYLLWHCVKLLFLGVLIVPLVIYAGYSVLYVLLVAVLWKIVFESCYRVFRKLRIHRYDKYCTARFYSWFLK